MPNDRTPLITNRSEIDAFFERRRALAKATSASNGCGRMIFAIDATGSRERSWDLACQVQGEMFEEAARTGALSIQLVYYRGTRECQASRWVADGRTLASLMEKIDCRTGLTQIGRVLDHVRKENALQRVQAVVFVGDAAEERPCDLFAAASGLRVPLFLFQENDDLAATRVFTEIARLTKGAHCRFTPGAARELAELLRAVATYATGGLQALSASPNAGAVKLLQQLK